MPSNKSPSDIVQPGPGRLPADTVPANALIFPPSGSSDAALQAHIQDSLEAHAASAIGAAGSPSWEDGTLNPSGNVQVKIDKIISDLASTSGVNYIGQPGFSGLTRDVPAGGTTDALTSLTNAVNSRAIFVVGSDPTNSDYTDFYTAVTDLDSLGIDAILYLRSGSHTILLNLASTIYENLIIIGEDPTNTTLVGIHQWNLGNNTQVYNCTISPGLGVSVQGSNGIVRNCRLTVDVTFNAGANNNLWEKVTTTGGATPTITVNSATGNTFRDFETGQFAINLSSDYTVIDGLTLGANSLATDDYAVDISANNCTLKNATFTGDLFSGLDQGIVNVSGSSGGGRNIVENIIFDNPSDTASSRNLLSVTHRNTVRNVLWRNVSAYSGSLLLVSGDSNNFHNLRCATVALNQSYLNVSGDYNQLCNLQFTNCSGSGNPVRVTGDSNEVENVHLTSTVTTTESLVFLQGSNNILRQLNIGTAVPASTFRWIHLSSAKNVLVEEVYATNCQDLDTVEALFEFNGVSQATLSHIWLDSVGTTNQLAVGGSIVEFSGITNNNIVLKNWHLSNVRCNGNAFNFPMGSIDGLTIEGMEWDLSGGITPQLFAGGSGIKFSGGSEPQTDRMVYVRNCRFQGVNGGDHTLDFGPVGTKMIFENCFIWSNSETNWALFGSDVRNTIQFKNCTIQNTQGQAVSCLNTGFQFDSCRILGSGTSTGDNVQLFQGSGYVSNAGSRLSSFPLVLNNCSMLIDDSNVDSSVAGDPIIFLGGSGSTPETNHGPIQVDGLYIDYEATGLVGGTLIAIDANNALNNPSSPFIFKNIRIDLQDQFATVSANLTGVYTNNGSILEIEGPTDLADPRARPYFQNISVIRVQNPSSNDVRHAVRARGAVIDGLMIDGPGGAAGPSRFGERLISVSSSELRNLDIFPRSGVRVLSSVIYALDGSFIRGGQLRNFVESESAVTLSNSQISEIHIVTDFDFPNHMISLLANSIARDCRVIWDLTDHSTVFRSLGSYVQIINNHVELTRTGGTVEGIMAHLSSDGLCHGNTFISGANVDARILTAGDYNRITTNRIAYGSGTTSASVAAIVVDGNFGTAFGNIVADNVLTSGNTGNLRIRVDSADSTVITGNLMHGTNGVGGTPVEILLEADALRTVVSANLLNRDTGGSGVVTLSGTGTEVSNGSNLLAP